jgi:hypothetical protein
MNHLSLPPFMSLILTLAVLAIPTRGGRTGRCSQWLRRQVPVTRFRR